LIIILLVEYGGKCSMSEVSNLQLSQFDAFRNVVASINSTAVLPAQVFAGDWYQFLFCESDRIFEPAFANVVTDLLLLEQANSCCFINFDTSPVIELPIADVLFVDKQITPVEFSASLRRGGPSLGWFYSMYRYGCTSDIGEWCIYFEKMNDMAVIGLRHLGSIEKFASPLKELYAHSIETFLEMGSSAPIPFNKLVDTWRHSLIRNYSTMHTEG
jgi:hypothetical protein